MVIFQTLHIVCSIAWLEHEHLYQLNLESIEEGALMCIQFDICIFNYKPLACIYIWDIPVYI